MARKGLEDILRLWIVSPYFQAALQLTVGTAVLSLFVFVEELRFPMSCNATVVYAAITMALFPDAHMGGRIMGSAIVLGCLLLGCAASGATVAAAWAARGSDTSLLEHIKTTLHGPPSEQKEILMQLVHQAQQAESTQVVGVANAEPKPKLPSLAEMEGYLRLIPIVGPSYYIMLCAMSSVLFLFVAVVRSDTESPVGALGGTIALLAGQIIILGGLATPVIGIDQFWIKVMRPVLRLGGVAITAVILSGTLVLPSLASKALMQSMAQMIEGIGQCVSRYTLEIDCAHDDVQREKGKGLGDAAVMAETGEQEAVEAPAAIQVGRWKMLQPRTAEADLASLRQATAAVRLQDVKCADNNDAAWPGPGPLASAGPSPGPATSAGLWRRIIPQAKLQLREAIFEPPIFAAVPMYQGRWNKALDALNVLIARAAALEEVCRLPLVLGSIPSSPEWEHSDLISVLSIARAAIASGCASIAYALRHPKDRDPTHGVSPGGPDGRGWDNIQSDLAGALQLMHRNCWRSFVNLAKTYPDHVTDFQAVHELRTAVHLFMLATSLVEATKQLERTVHRALCRETRPSTPGDPDSHVKVTAAEELLATSSRKSCLMSSEVKDSLAVSEDETPDLEAQEFAKEMSSKQMNGGEKHGARIHEGKVSGEARAAGEGSQPTVGSSHAPEVPTGPSDGVSTAKETKGGHGWSRWGLPGQEQQHKEKLQLSEKQPKAPAKEELSPWLVWLMGIVACTSSAVLFQRVAVVLIHFVQRLKSPKDLAVDLQSRAFVFGVKYWIALTGTMTAIIVLLVRDPAGLTPWQLTTTFIVVSVCLQPMVEDTGYKTLLRLGLLLAAGAIGFGVMSSYAFATSPAGIMAFLCVIGFMFGHMNGLIAIKYPMFFFMVTIYSMLLCQYTGHSTGTLLFFGARVLTTLVGSGLCLVFGVLLFPWYTSSHCQEQLAVCLGASLQLCDRMWTDFVAAAVTAGNTGKDVAIASQQYTDVLVNVIDRNLDSVEEAAKEDVLPFKVPYLSERDLITPVPAVVTLMLAAVSRQANHVASAQLALSQQSWRGDSGALVAWNVPGLMSRPLGRIYASNLDAEMRAHIASCTLLAGACQDNLKANRRARQAEMRELIEERLAEAEASCLRLRNALRGLAPRAVEVALGLGNDCFQEIIVLEAWLASFLASLDDVLCVARTCLLKECQQRDAYWSWLGCV